MPFDNFTLGGYNMAQAHAGQQGGHLAGMANQAMAAINAENQSRVAQMREMRRMEHERQMKQMEINALIQRLEMEQKAARSRGGDGMGFEFNEQTGRWDRW